MKGLTSNDGKMTGNRQLVDTYNKSKTGGGKKAQRPANRGGESGGAHEDSGHDEIKKVVAEHGPAHTHLISKSGDGFHSTTHHEDGHMHHADHSSLEEAHEHGTHAMDDADHMGDMSRDDHGVAGEHDDAEGGSGMGGSSVGYMD